MARARQQWRAQTNGCRPGQPGLQNPAYRPALLFMALRFPGDFWRRGVKALESV